MIGQEFVARLREAPIRPAEIARFLDGLSHEERVEAIRAVGRSDQRALYEAVKGFARVELTDLVPPAQKSMVPVRHFGKNTLPAFSHFEKRMCRPPEADAAAPGELWGFNFQTMQPITGPGYFVARASDAAPEVLVDYHFLPDSQPTGWPEIRSNERGLSRFVYGYMVDTLRRVSEHVTIGSAARKGKDMGSWFLLTRESSADD